MDWELTIDGDAVALRWLERGTGQVSPRVIVVGTAHRLEWEGLEAMRLEQQNVVEATALQHLMSLGAQFVSGQPRQWNW